MPFVDIVSLRCLFVTKQKKIVYAAESMGLDFRGNGLDIKI